jgi:hypothetical protein
MKHAQPWSWRICLLSNRLPHLWLAITGLRKANLPDGYHYASDNNTDWLTVPSEIQEMVAPMESELGKGRISRMRLLVTGASGLLG